MDVEKDFSRNVWCLLGLPFDAVNRDEACAEIVAAAENRQSCFFSTPNLNFLCAAQHDSNFRQSVINSDLSVADGFPIVLLAKLLNIPLPERVAGSDVIDQLNQRTTPKPLAVFFFGGEPGVGELASNKVNAQAGGLRAAGHYAPGFGSVEAMSSPEIIANINRLDIDFLIVSLGAKKGQAWIENNRASLNAPVISHLGAVINFFAGTVVRAPLKWQKFGLEWLWRIYQEPSLWRRYYNDGKDFLSLVTSSVIPYAFWLKFNSRRGENASLSVTQTTAEDCLQLELSGACLAGNLAPLRAVFSTAARENTNVIIDLSQTTLIDSAFLGLCLILMKHVSANGKTLRLCHPNKSIRRLMHWQRVDYLLG